MKRPDEGLKIMRLNYFHPESLGNDTFADAQKMFSIFELKDPGSVQEKNIDKAFPCGNIESVSYF